MVSAAACVLAGLAQPSLLGLPYVVATALAVWRWGRRQGRTPPRALLLAGQVYAGKRRHGHTCCKHRRKPVYLGEAALQHQLFFSSKTPQQGQSASALCF